MVCLTRKSLKNFLQLFYILLHSWNVLTETFFHRLTQSIVTFQVLLVFHAKKDDIRKAFYTELRDCIEEVVSNRNAIILLFVMFSGCLRNYAVKCLLCFIVYMYFLPLCICRLMLWKMSESVSICISNSKQLLDEAEHDIKNYSDLGQCYLPKRSWGG